MLPASGWLGVYDMDSPIGTVLPLPLPVVQVEVYADGAEVVDESDVEYPTVIHTAGDFDVEVSTGRDDTGAFGFEINITRRATYGTFLVDRIDFNTAVIDMQFESCPNTSVFDTIDTASDIVTTADEVPNTPIFLTEEVL